MRPHSAVTAIGNIRRLPIRYLDTPPSRYSSPGAGPSRLLPSSKRGSSPLPRPYATKPNNLVTKERYNFNTSMNFSEDPDPDHINHRRVTAGEILNRREPPTRVKMLVRDFIDDSLYNPHYGYFSRNATIFTPPDEGYDFGSFRDAAHFQETVAERYEQEYGSMELVEGGGKVEAKGKGGLGRQVWHTPTELFKPYYARTLIKPILHTYKLNHFPYQDLIMYEVGAGNGSFMLDALKYIREEHPDVYERTQYKIVEISPALAKIQKERASAAGLADKVDVINEDVMRWKGGRVEPCFVIALEVFDNFAHDMVRYDLRTLEPLQAIICIDASGDFSLLYEKVTDPLLRRVLAYRRYLPPSASTSPPLPSPVLRSPLLRSMYTALPFAPNLSGPDWIPTKATHFLERLRDRLPNHRLMVADFDSLPEAVDGRNGPVVQTRYGGSMVPCETILVKQGYFDIFFPTDFELLRDTYSLIMNSPPTTLSDPDTYLASASTSPVHESPSSFSSTPSPSATVRPVSSLPTAASPSSQYTAALTASHPSLSSDFFSSLRSPSASASATGVRGFRHRQVRIHTHADFVRRYGAEEAVMTRTGDGEGVMLSMYKNAKVMF